MVNVSWLMVHVSMANTAKHWETLVSPKGWAGAGVGIGIMRGGGVPLIEIEKTSKDAKVVGFFVSWFLSFFDSEFQSFKASEFQTFNILLEEIDTYSAF